MDSSTQSLYENMFKMPEGLSEFVYEDEKTIVDLDLDLLHDFKDHPFKVHRDLRFDKLVSSIKENGVSVPILVRPHPDLEGEYEILAGHRRTHASRVADQGTVPAIIRKGLSDDEAKIVVVETNFAQRSSSDMLPSEKAKAIAMESDALKQLRREAKLNKDIEEGRIMYEGGGKGRNKTQQELALKYDMTPTDIYRYTRLAECIPSLLDLIDEKKIGVGAGVECSFIEEEAQNIIANYVMDEQCKLPEAKARKLKKINEEELLTRQIVHDVLTATGKATEAKAPVVKIKGDFLSEYYPSASVKEVENEIQEAIILKEKIIPTIISENGCSPALDTQSVNNLIRMALEFYFSNNQSEDDNEEIPQELSEIV